VLRLKAGDPIVEVVNTLHYGINEGTVPAEIVVFYAGIVGQTVTVSRVSRAGHEREHVGRQLRRGDRQPREWFAR
jgi:hypothetical protein